MRVINYDYIQEISAEDALKNSASDVTSWYNWGIPWVNTFKINAETSVYNEQWGWDWQWIAWWSTDISWTPWVWSISWTSGNLSLPDWTQIAVSSWSASITAPTYIYCDTTDWSVYSTTHSYDAVWENKIMICAAFPNSWKNVTFKAFWCADQNSAVTWADIAAGTIVANNIASWTITANQIASWTITANEIASNTITASEMNVSRLSAISANLWDITAGTITGTTITAGNTSSSAVRMYPSWSSWYLQFYYSWSTVWTIQWQYISWVGNTVAISGTNIALDWKVWCLSKLRIPVWTNMY
jgi:hypothetical protein